MLTDEERREIEEAVVTLAKKAASPGIESQKSLHFSQSGLNISLSLANVLAPDLGTNRPKRKTKGAGA